MYIRDLKRNKEYNNSKHMANFSALHAIFVDIVALSKMVQRVNEIGDVENHKIFHLSISSCLQISRPTNFLLLHISGLFTIIALLFLIFSVPSLYTKSNIAGKFLCGFQGFTNFLFHPLALWSVAGAHLDRYYFVAYPLR